MPTNPKTDADEDKSPNDMRSAWYQSLCGKTQEAMRLEKGNRKYSLKSTVGQRENSS